MPILSDSVKDTHFLVPNRFTITKTTEFLFDSYQKIDLVPGMKEAFSIVVLLGENHYVYGVWQWFRHKYDEIWVGKLRNDDTVKGMITIAYDQGSLRRENLINCDYGDISENHHISFSRYEFILDRRIK